MQLLPADGTKLHRKHAFGCKVCYIPFEKGLSWCFQNPLITLLEVVGIETLRSQILLAAFYAFILNCGETPIVRPSCSSHPFPDFLSLLAGGEETDALCLARWLLGGLVCFDSLQWSLVFSCGWLLSAVRYVAPQTP